MDQLIRLPEKAALQGHFDARNYRSLFRLLLFCVVTALVISVVMAAQERYAELALPAANLVLVRLLYMIREREVFSRHFRLFLLIFIILQALLWKAMYFDLQAAWHPADFVAPMLLVFFRLPPGHLAVPLGTIWALSVGRHLVQALLTDDQLDYTFFIGQTALTLGVFSIVNGVTSKQRSSFLVAWRRELHRHRERRRMQEELDDARKIQLSMLPRSEPRIPWLDVAGISIPASEVGGDYFDYFTISETKQAIVVGDVAGHGVASGLLLSGVRSCLHLLHESELEPVEILGKIDRMLRQTHVRRNFVTLLYALFDYERRTFTFSALPLGTRLASEPRQRSIPIAENDIFMLFTDGIAETVNSRGDVYGDARLRQRLRGMSYERTAREIRDTVLGDVWTFKADGEQLDDITVVVAKVR